MCAGSVDRKLATMAHQVVVFFSGDLVSDDAVCCSRSKVLTNFATGAQKDDPPPQRAQTLESPCQASLLTKSPGMRLSETNKKENKKLLTAHQHVGPEK